MCSRPRPTPVGSHRRRPPARRQRSPGCVRCWCSRTAPPQTTFTTVVTSMIAPGAMVSGWSPRCVNVRGAARCGLWCAPCGQAAEHRQDLRVLQLSRDTVLDGKRLMPPEEASSGSCKLAAVWDIILDGFRTQSPHALPRTMASCCLKSCHDGTRGLTGRSEAQTEAGTMPAVPGECSSLWIPHWSWYSSVLILAAPSRAVNARHERCVDPSARRLDRAHTRPPQPRR